MDNEQLTIDNGLMDNEQLIIDSARLSICAYS